MKRSFAFVWQCAALWGMLLLADPAMAQRRGGGPPGPLQQAARLDHEGRGSEARAILQAFIDTVSDPAQKAQAYRRMAMSYAFEGDCANTIKYEQMVIDDELCNMINRGLRGIGVDPESLALHVIAEVGQRGNYLSTEHTLRRFREELFLPSLFDRRGFGERGEEGLEILEKARSKVRGILARPCESPIRPETEERMEQILQKVLADIKKRDVEMGAGKSYMKS